MKDTYIVFSRSHQGAKILVNPPADVLAPYYKSGATILKNPERESVHGVPLHLWSPDTRANSVRSSMKGVVLHMGRHAKKNFNWGYAQQVVIVTVIVELIHLLREML